MALAGAAQMAAALARISAAEVSVRFIVCDCGRQTPEVKLRLGNGFHHQGTKSAKEDNDLKALSCLSLLVSLVVRS
jgi:hypothetical protein